MAEPEPKIDAKELRLRARVGGMRRLATVILLWETLWPAFWPAILIAGTFLALALFDVLPMLPGWLHGLLLVGFAGAFVFAVYRARMHLRMPGRRAAERRIEQASDLPHRPLTALDDQPAEDPLTPAQGEVWRVHRERMAAAIKRLRIGFPRASLTGRDPFGLRVILALVLVVAIVDAKGDASRRLMRAITPHFPSVVAAAPTLDVWVAPPDYTGLPTIVLAKSADAPGAANRRPHGEIVHVPAGSTLFAQVHGGRTAPRLRLGKNAIEFSPLGADSYHVRAALRTPEKMVIEQNHGELASWTLAVVPDLPPSIDFKDKPTQSERGALRISFRVTDDYGVVSAKGVIARAQSPDPDGPAPRAKGGAKPQTIEVPLPLPGGRVTSGEGASYHDLTAHPWAGTNVTLRLEAKDGAGQIGTSKTVTFVLPERKFHNEIAREIVALRKKLTLNPEARRLVAGRLALIESDHAKYHDDIVVYLALNSAVDRLLLDRSAEAIPSVQALLWDTALRLEDEGASLAQRDLRDIQKKLQDALAKGASPEEIKRLMDKLQEAMDHYLDAMMRDYRSQQNQQGQPGEQAQPPDAGQMQSYRPEELRDMLNKARELAQMGDREGAERMLSRLQDILENLKTPRAADSKAQRQAREAMQNMRDLIKRQQDLLDRTYEAAKPPLTPPGAPLPGMPGRPGAEPPAAGKPGEQAGPGQKGSRGTSAEAAEQEALRKALGDTMLKFGDMLGKIPGELGRAERAMRESEQALKQDSPGQAVSPETKAVDQLQQAMKSLREELAKRNQGARPGGSQAGPGGQGRDPLGRPLPDRGGQGTNTGDVRIPDQMELRHAREILDELRRRAGQPDRSEEERDYIDRLLPAY